MRDNSDECDVTTYLWALLAVVFDSSVFGGNVQPHDDLRGEQLHALGTLVMVFHVGNPPDPLAPQMVTTLVHVWVKNDPSAVFVFS